MHQKWDYQATDRQKATRWGQKATICSHIPNYYPNLNLKTQNKAKTFSTLTIPRTMWTKNNSNFTRFCAWDGNVTLECVVKQDWVMLQVKWVLVERGTVHLLFILPPLFFFLFFSPLACCRLKDWLLGHPNEYQIQYTWHTASLMINVSVSTSWTNRTYQTQAIVLNLENN